MNKYYSGRFQKDICIIYPGEMFVCDSDMFIATVLGSCISIALFDTKKCIGGLNHFMLPKANLNSTMLIDVGGRYGDYAIELLLNEMMKKGARKENLVAKVFGGAAVLKTEANAINKTGENNISFAISYLETEKIPIIAKDIGGIFPRKIFFHPQTAKVYLKRIKKQAATMENIHTREEEYQKSLKKNIKNSGDIIWF